MTLDQAIEAVGKGVDVVGILIIVVGAVVASVRFGVGAGGSQTSEAYSLYRRTLGRAILLGLTEGSDEPARSCVKVTMPVSNEQRGTSGPKLTL